MILSMESQRAYDAYKAGKAWAWLEMCNDKHGETID